MKQEATVLLTGDGGDDIFLGYPEHKIFWMAQRLAAGVPAAAGPVWKQLRRVFPKKGLGKSARLFADFAIGGLGTIATNHDGLPFYWNHDLLGDRLKGRTVANRGIPWSQASARNLLDEFLRYDRATRFTGEYLTKVDGAAMRYAVEARSPFLDHRLWEFAGTLPFGLRLRNGTLKAVLREMARRNIDARVAKGAKKGFGIPVRRWLASRWGPVFEQTMRESQLGRQGYLDAPKVVEVWKKYAASGEVPNQLWYLFVLETWFRHQCRAAKRSV